jgi:hypothetical protein
VRAYPVVTFLVLSANQSVARGLQTSIDARDFGCVDAGNRADIAAGSAGKSQLVFEECSDVAARNSAALRLIVESYDAGVAHAVDRNDCVGSLGRPATAEHRENRAYANQCAQCVHSRLFVLTTI